MDRYYGHQLEKPMHLNYPFYSQASDMFGTSTYSGLSDSDRLTFRYFNNQSYNTNVKQSNGVLTKYNGNGQNLMHTNNMNPVPQQLPASYGNYCNRNRYAPYYNNRGSFSNTSNSMQYQQQPQYNNLYGYGAYSSAIYPSFERSDSGPSSSSSTSSSSGTEPGEPVTLQINNLDYSLDEGTLRNFLLGQLKPITPVLSLTFEGCSFAKVTVPDTHFAKQVVSNLHRKKIGHKRMVVSYTRDSSLTEINTLRCQVAGLLKDVPFWTLPMYKFRELFQSRFKTSISVLDLYKMQDICNITTDKNDDKYIILHPDLVNSIESSPLMECLQHSVPYCTLHFKREQHKGWAEQDIEPLPNVFMTISEIQAIIYPLLKSHTGDIPVASLVHCISGELGIQIISNDNGVNLEHLICCVHGIQINTNKFGVKILGWLEPENAIGKDANDGRFYLKSGTTSDPLYQISREVVELVKMSPKSTMKFNRFIPAYHNHFGKQCRVADYGYTKLIELFEALSTVVQIMGDGENRLITLLHRTQIRRFTSDLLRILRLQGNKSILLSQLSTVFSQTLNRKFDVTDYGICDIIDILDGLVNSNTVVISKVQNENDILISIPKRKQTSIEIEKTCVFAGEVVELLRNASNYSILFQKFVRSYHYHFGYQCRLSDYGYLKLADLMEAIQGVVEIEFTSDEDKRIHLSVNVAQRVFAEQLEELVRDFTGSSKTCIKLEEVLQLHKKKYGYQIQSQTLGFDNIFDAVKILPYIELLQTDEMYWIICHYDDPVFRSRSYRACKIIQEFGKDVMLLDDFLNAFKAKYNESLSQRNVAAMKHAIEIRIDNEVQYVALTSLMKFIISIIRILEQRYMMLSEIKSIVNFGIGNCFQYGYPNLYTLLRAYPDIFVVEIGSSQERSEIGLVAQCDLISHKSRPQEKKPIATGCSDRLLQALVPHNLKSNLFDCADAVASHTYFKQNCKDNESYKSTNKENSYNSTFNGSFNSSLTSDPNTSAGSNSSGYCNGVGLWNRRQGNRLRDSDFFDIVNKPSIHSYYAPPKPDTPCSDHIPFWVDPIWKNRNGEKSPKINSLNIHLPEFKSLNILPMIMSPYTLSKMENMKQMFSFDK